MTVFFQRVRGTLPCPRLTLKTPEADRMTQEITYPTDTYWSTWGPYLNASAHSFPPGMKARIFGRLGWPKDEE